jgi:hypothetical protein
MEQAGGDEARPAGGGRGELHGCDEMVTARADRAPASATVTSLEAGDASLESRRREAGPERRVVVNLLVTYDEEVVLVTSWCD